MPEFEIQALQRIYDAFSRWDVDELAVAFENQFGEKVEVHKVVRPDGVTVHTFRPRLSPAFQ